jgi:hypothetical protein
MRHVSAEGPTSPTAFLQRAALPRNPYPFVVDRNAYQSSETTNTLKRKWLL